MNNWSRSTELGQNSTQARLSTSYRHRDTLSDLVGGDLLWVTDEALCTQVEAPFFPAPSHYEQVQAAREVCERCPLIEPCREYGVTHGVDGGWGGTSDSERQRIRKQRGIRLPGRRKDIA